MKRFFHFLIVLIVFESIISSKFPTEGCLGGQPPEWNYENYLLNDTFLSVPEWAYEIMETLTPKLISLMNQDYPPGCGMSCSDNPWNFYGISGRAYLHLRIFKASGFSIEDLDLARLYVEEALSYLVESKEISYWKGNVGVFGVAAMVYHLQGNKTQEEYYIQKVIDQFGNLPPFSNNDFVVPSNLDDGIAGLVQLSRALKDFYGYDVIPYDLVLHAMIHLSEMGIQNINTTTNAMQFYTGHEDWVIGVGEGSGGAIYLMMKFEEIMSNKTFRKAIKNTIDYFITQQNPVTGEVRSDYPDRVQWCHGSPGFVSVFLQAYKCFGDITYLNAAKLAAEYTAKKGILLKGMHIGHGTAGNIYQVMEMYRFFKDNTKSEESMTKWLSKSLSMLLVSLKMPEYLDMKKWVSYDCVPGSMFVSHQAGMILLFIDILSNKDDISKISIPLFGEKW